MYERFSDRAKKVMHLANAEAQRLGYGLIGTEHILLGLIKEGNGIAIAVLNNLKVDLDQVLQKTPAKFRLLPAATAGELPQTLFAKYAIDEAVNEATRHNCRHVGTEHLLFGLASIGGIAGEVLSELGVTPEKIRNETASLIGRPAREQTPETDELKKDFEWIRKHTWTATTTQGVHFVPSKGDLLKEAVAVLMAASAEEIAKLANDNRREAQFLYSILQLKESGNQCQSNTDG